MPLRVKVTMTMIFFSDLAAEAPLQYQPIRIESSALPRAHAYAEQ
jgi:hypothetical protein